MKTKEESTLCAKTTNLPGMPLV